MVKILITKKKGHPGNLPNNRISEEKEHSRQYEQIEDIVTHEAFKNRGKKKMRCLNIWKCSISVETLY
ncbi:hypothetical protein RCO48_06825 [Peribacillus frigoritolerans]|nr:hypothetical protein [Peribacillus frigoritolerans]